MWDVNRAIRSKIHNHEADRSKFKNLAIKTKKVNLGVVSDYCESVDWDDEINSEEDLNKWINKSFEGEKFKDFQSDSYLAIPKEGK